MLKYANQRGLFVKANVPKNNFPVSMIPWTSFEGFNLNLQKSYDFYNQYLQWVNIIKKMIRFYCL